MKQEDYEQRIKAALEAAGNYNASLDISILVLAGVLVSLELFNRVLSRWIAEMDAGQLGWDDIENSPLFKRQREAEDNFRKISKELGLTAEDTRQVSGDDDPMAEMLQAMKKEINRPVARGKKR